MAFLHGKAGYFGLGTSGAEATASDISSYIESVDFPVTADVAETTTFGKNSKTYVVGLKDGKFSVKGKWDATQDAAIWAVIGDATALAFDYGPGGSTSGYVEYTGDCFITEYQPSTPVNDVVSWTMSLQITGDVTRGTF